ncbi:MAG: hypothetical protein M1823_005040 [Watsoniomyces obsoletus]|nr:MAG: hypothetical protein M1823_005040 [Watsoniomyces obsoletus]
MADVRALLRSELATRRITHPYASYSGAGTLSCNLCKQAIKSHSLWETHLRAASHLARVSQQQQQTTSGPENGSKKRRLDEGGDDEEDVSGDGREKRRRRSVDGQESNVADEEDLHRNNNEGNSPAKPAEAESTQEKQIDVNEDEWAAFEQDIAQVATIESQNAMNALNASTVISAPALSASELQNRRKGDARGEKNEGESELEEKRRKAKEEEEAEREDARRRLEEEWEVMHSYEERVKRLKMRREELRLTRHDGGGDHGAAGAGDALRGGGGGEDDVDAEMGEEDGSRDDVQPPRTGSGARVGRQGVAAEENDKEGGENESDEDDEEEEWNSRWDPF